MLIQFNNVDADSWTSTSYIDQSWLCSVDESSPVPIADWSEEMNAEDNRQSGYYTDSILTGRGPRGGGGGYRPRGRGGRYPRGSGYSSNRSSGTEIDHDQQLQIEAFYFWFIIVYFFSLIPSFFSCRRYHIVCYFLFILVLNKCISSGQLIFSWGGISSSWFINMILFISQASD